MSTLLQANSSIAHPNKMLNERENVHPRVLQNTVSNIVNRQIWDVKNYGGNGNTSQFEQMDTSGSESEELSHKQKRAIERNQRERLRMSRLNSAFDDLRNRLPSTGERKISKKDTLLKAIEYIGHLNQVLKESENVVPMGFNATMLLEEVRKHWSMTIRLTCVPRDLQAGTSQIQCLELAMAYISFLQAILEDPQNGASCHLSDTVCNILNGRRSYVDRAKEEQRTIF
ncbi:hypothetical protein CAEBREN_06976 [Caenorhabditis brenneri]|uniref:BHLH domain-containing protein n=1 Tax=Caenorhabditis brenneri TaxID=135651 RepID=G0MCS9_CAEBE|nr:hypothetical protein CAEBREN_06976 [Caenorhabditis brenneri]